MTRYTGRHRSIFGPLVLIGVGAVFLMINLGLIESVQLIHLARLWPLLLVGAGINLLFQRQPWVGNLIAVLLVGGALAFLFFAPQLGLENPGGDMVTESFNAPLGSATSANVRLDIDRGSLNVSGQHLGANLIEAEVLHNQRVTFSSTDEETLLKLDAVDFVDLFGLLSGAQMRTTVLLSTDIPLSLNANLGAGASTLDLTALNLTALRANAGSGSLTAMLPGGDYAASLNAGSGGLTIQVAPGAVIDLSANLGSGRSVITLGAGVSGDLELDSGSGTVSITVPAGVGLEISAQTGSGRVNLPPGLVRISGSEQAGPSVKGVWRSEGFDAAELKLYLDIRVGSGSLEIVIGE